MSSAALTLKNPKEDEDEDEDEVENSRLRPDLGFVPNRFIYSYSKDRDASRRVLVPLYAGLGLHRYNFLMGKDMQLGSIIKYTKTTYSLPSVYEIQFEAKDPAAAKTTKPQLFEAKVDELDYNVLILVSGGSGTYPAESKEHLEDLHDNVLGGNMLQEFMPDELPPEENPFQKFHLLKKSEVLKNEWIRLYLELAVATTNRHHIKKHGMAVLKIHKVAMQITRELEPFEGLGAYDATFYIKYTDDCKDRTGHDGDRVAIVRRIVDVHLGIFRIIGLTQSFQTIPSSNGITAMEASPQD